MNKSNKFINKEEIDKLFSQEKYKNCVDKKYFEYLVANEKIEYIDKYLKKYKNRRIIESSVLENKIVKVMDKLIVKPEGQKYIGELEKYGINKIEVSSEIVSKYCNQLLTEGVFALVTLEENIDKDLPYYIEEIEVLEEIDISLDEYIEYFQRESDDEDIMNRISLILNTIGISTEQLTFWEKILFLVRLIPLCESNYNLMELGGNGIGKTKTYSMFSPECEIVQEMLTTELIYNMQSKAEGLLSTKNVIVFDEVNKIKIDSNNQKIIPQLLNFMADGKTTSPRKITSKTSLVFSGNVLGIEERIEKNEKNVFDNPHKLEDSAFLDRIHFFLPAWGLRRYSKNIHGTKELKDVFRFDYFAKVLDLLREEDYSTVIEDYNYEFKNASEREILAIRKTVSGLIKLIYPDKESINDEVLESFIAIAIKGRGLINKFLNNKSKNNVKKIEIKVKKIYKSIDVNKSLKKFIFENNRLEMEYYLEESKEIHYSNKIKEKEIYPNRQIFSYDNLFRKSEILIVKIALDKIGILKNKREKEILGKYYKNSEVYLKNGGRTLIFLDEGEYEEDVENHLKNSIKSMEYLYDEEDLNYDGLFGDESLDENEFTINNGYSYKTRNIETDLSTLYLIDKKKKLKDENGKYIIPIFKYNKKLNKYYYEEFDDDDNLKKDEVTSKMMTYVEFKYFLSENGFIELN